MVKSTLPSARRIVINGVKLTFSTQIASRYGGMTEAENFYIRRDLTFWPRHT